MDQPITGIIILVLLFVLTVGGLMAGLPQYHVYSARLEGEAELAKANQNRQILITQAQAEKEAAQLRAVFSYRSTRFYG